MTFHQSSTCQAMSEQEYFLLVNKHLFFAWSAKQPCCSVLPCGTPQWALQRRQKKIHLGWLELLVFILKAWNPLSLLCLELLDWWNCSLPSLKSFKLRQFLCSSSSSSCGGQGFSSGIPCRSSRGGSKRSLWVIWWQKDKVAWRKGPQPLQRRVSRRSPWALPALCYIAGCCVSQASTESCSSVSGGVNVNRCISVTSCVAKSTQKSQSRLGKQKAACLMVSRYFWRAWYVGGGVAQEQCVYVKLSKN